ncbi:MAG: 6,7-dimethyl-8-ribityllumazine synthase [Bacteroidetes bacterium]|nr:MAG: 6,7-dimethyl-8-ribityllumazine synthase [Bacteroidota bacterium]REK07047.1 MAG: 6,7-dimethyl-8-ribityllumazine synthase [Bacteroidota bacterium]REK33606.1 MAG: 6,7-dimethyl-8-ribityllumazine synthase [Bacteroidota bacterium]REK48591.1 MAG: 6,7-dimethyl-8-ribityllumazine synthase [Bacteroidota bacterium]
MADKKINLSEQDFLRVPDATGMKFGIIVSDWNSEITYSMKAAALDILKAKGVNSSDIFISHVPGSYELTSGAQFLAEKFNPDALICIGCVIQGETRHFEFICNAVANGLTNLGLQLSKPVIFGVLTTDNLEQARARSGGKYGNKGVEAAVTAIYMAALKRI